MKKKSIIALLVFLAVSALYIIFGRNLYDFMRDKSNYMVNANEYLYGSATGEKGKIGLRLRVDGSGAIKEVVVTEHTDSEIAIQALQKLIDDSLDKESAEEIDVVSGATDTSNTYKSIISALLSDTTYYEDEDNNKKVSLTDPENQTLIERRQIGEEEGGYKSGLGGYIFNTFQDADYNRNGNLVTNEYVCAVVLNRYNRIEQVKFDHIVSNISFDRFGKVPTGSAKAYVFTSDKSKSGFNGLVNDGNYVNIFDFEKQVLNYKHFEEIKSKFINKKGYAPLVNALENAIDNARFIGANQEDPVGLSVNKILKKRDITNSTEEENGKVHFVSNYCLVTTNKENKISSCMFDNVVNTVTLTNNGKILGSREKEIYTLNELANIKKYSKIDSSKFNMKQQLNALADFMRDTSIDDLLKVISEYTDDRGMAKAGSPLSDLKNIDFIEFIDLISRAYIDSITILKNQ